MKRLLVFLLLLALPLQYAWAVAGAYCTHEQSFATSHFGHHPHQHQTQGDEDPTGSGLKIHTDCASCHVGTCAMVDEVTGLAAHAVMAAVPSSTTVIPSSAPPVEPERPKWPFAV
jgi:hypothetical protein